MICLDTNIVIAFGNERLNLNLFKKDIVIHPSVVRIESLGFVNIGRSEERHISDFLDLTRMVALTPDIVERAIELRQMRKIGLGDAIIAATALEYDCELWTANTRDFQEIEGLKLRNPLSVN